MCQTSTEQSLPIIKGQLLLNVSCYMQLTSLRVKSLFGLLVMGPAHQSEFLGTNYSQTRAESISCNKEFD